MAWIYLTNNPLEDQPLREQYRLWCDAFAIPGLLMLLSSGLLWALREGALDGLTYCLRAAAFTLIPMKRKDAFEKYGDYVERKNQNRVHGFAFLLFSGGGVTLIALVLYLLYYLN